MKRGINVASTNKHLSPMIHCHLSSPKLTADPKGRYFTTITLEEGKQDQPESDVLRDTDLSNKSESSSGNDDNDNASKEVPKWRSRIQQHIQAGEVDSACSVFLAVLHQCFTHNGPHFSDFAMVIRAFSGAKGRRNAELVTRVLEQLVEFNKTLPKKRNLSPLVHTVLQVWSSCTLAPQKNVKIKHVQEISSIAKLAKTILLDVKGNGSCTPTLASYNLVLENFVKATKAASAAGASSKTEEECLQLATLAAEQAEELLILLIEDGEHRPDLDSFKSVLLAWAHVRSLDGTERLLALMNLVENTFDQVDASLYSIVFYGLAQTAPLMEFDPANSQVPVNKAVALLRRLVSQLGENKNVLNDMSYASVIEAFSKTPVSKDYGELAPANLAAACLRQCRELHEIGYLTQGPNDYCYGHAIAAWTRHADVNLGCEKAQDLLDRLHEHVGNKTANPQRRQRLVIWYNMVIDCLSKSTLSDAPHRAETILQRMGHLANDASYHAMLATYAAASEHDYIDRAQALLQTMPYPSMACRNMALVVCASAMDKVKALAVAEEMFCSMPEPNAASYSRMLSVYRHALVDNEPERVDKMGALFLQCCRDGQMSQYSLLQLQKGLSLNRLERLLGRQFLHVTQGNYSKLPPAWFDRGSRKRKDTDTAE
jgi:hypothetical protein